MATARTFGIKPKLMYNILSVGDFDRTQVLILGEYPIDTKPFINRNLIVTKVTLNEAQEQFATSKAIIVADYPSKFNLIQKSFAEVFPMAENYGLAQKVIFHNDSDFLKIKDLGTSDYFYFSEKIEELAESIARYSCGPPPNQAMEINGKISDLDNEDIILLRRSFHDCSKIYVEPIGGGKDAKHLLKIYAWMGNSEVEAAMVPYFAKISTPDKIEEEFKQYRVTAEYLSFQYRPNCRIERRVSTQNYACLVGNFVNDAIPLLKALKDNHHTGIIHALFEKSLRGFRRRPLLAKKSTSVTTFQKFINERIKIGELAKRNDLIAKAKEFGFKSDLIKLQNKLLAICTEPCKTGIIHGDLHLGNVMVSGQDAIVIDFSGIILSGPLTADPATLLVSLCFDTVEKPVASFKEWRTFVDEIYDPIRLKRPISFTDKVPDKLFWVRNAVREVHHILIGCDRCKGEIESIIACYLMRIARLAPRESDGKNFEFKCRAYALVLAERIINSLDNKNTDHQP